MRKEVDVPFELFVQPVPLMGKVRGVHWAEEVPKVLLEALPEQ